MMEIAAVCGDHTKMYMYTDRAGLQQSVEGSRVWKLCVKLGKFKIYILDEVEL